IRSGTAADGPLVESWELARDEQLPDDGATAANFDPQPPPALSGWDAGKGEPPGRPQPRTVTITEALALAQTPLFTLAPSSTAVPQSIAIGPPPETAAWTLPDRTAPFEGALNAGRALRLSYIRDGDQALPITLYEGPVEIFGDYLRTQARWSRSNPIL